jgi:molecular chaperone HtpG
MSKKNHVFKAEIQQVLDLVIHSLYSKKEIFLRELISNASDAIDRAQYLGLTDKSVTADAPQWKIDIIADKDNKTLMICDNGMGMSEEEMDKNLGVIASSGTKAFTEALKQKQEVNVPELIGQFGVGFYSAFMVAEEVTVISLKRGEGQKAVRWTSTGNGTYSLEDAARDKPGTTIALKLREGMDEFFDTWRIRELVKKYSNFIAYPIRFGEKGEAPKDDAEALNTMKALWKRSKSDVKQEEYDEFYTHISHDHQAPLKVVPISAEGQIEFKALLFIPKSAGMDLFMPNNKHGLSLYVRNVFIGADFDLLLPEYLRFVKGVVDSSDLPLNVSREMLQDDAVIRKIKSNITGKILSTLAEMQKDAPADYNTFFTGFGRILKEGLHFDYENTDKLKGLVLFHSAKRENNGFISLKEYVAAMPEAQKEIYYLISDDLQTAKQSPHIEVVSQYGYDILFLTDPVDAYIIDRLSDYEGKKLVPLDKGHLELGSDEEKSVAKRKLEDAATEFKALTEVLKEQLKEEISEVRFSPRLTDSACCLVAPEHAMNASMERMMRAMNQEVPKQLRILELNPSHELIKKMNTMVAANGADPVLKDYADLLLGQALLGEGNPPKDPQRFTRLVTNLMTRG